MNKGVSILTHANCTDGLMAAYVVWKWFIINNIPTEVIYCQYDKSQPDVNFNNIMIVDFSFKPEIVDNWCMSGKNVVMLDHHQTAADMYEGYVDYKCKCYPNGKLFTRQIVKEKSGTGLAYDCITSQSEDDIEYLAYNLNRKFQLKMESTISLKKWFTDNNLKDNYKRLTDLCIHTEDRDLWRFNFSDTDIYYELINSYDKSMEFVDTIVMLSKEDWETNFTRASAKVEFRQKLAKDYASKAKTFNFAGYENIPIVNCPADFASKTCEILAKGKPFSVSFVMNTEVVFISLRSQEGIGEDVAAIAEKYSGGGHKHSAGILLRSEQILDFLQGKM